MKKGQNLHYKLTYKLDITISEEDSITPKKTTLMLRRRKKNPIGDIKTLEGNSEVIKQKICKTLDDLFEELRVWYYGPDEEG